MNLMIFGFFWWNAFRIHIALQRIGTQNVVLLLSPMFDIESNILIAY